MKRKVKCIVCGKTFETNANHRSICSDECYAKRRKEAWKTYDEELKTKSTSKKIALAKEKEKAAMKRRLEARDAEYAAKFPDLASGDKRGRFSGTIGFHITKI